MDWELLAVLIPFAVVYGHFKLRKVLAYQYAMEVLMVGVLLLTWYIAFAPHRVGGLKTGMSLIFR